MALIELSIEPREKDLGGFTVRRILPYAKRRMVGPFIFLDHMGPVDVAAGHGTDVRPHPHIGLSTVSYLFEGELFHRDTLGNAQEILPGEINWMTAGRGIAHSERTSQEVRSIPHRAHGLQSWVALPKEYEEVAPEFNHYAPYKLPRWSQAGVDYTLLCGQAFGHESPVKIYSPMFYVEVRMAAGATLTLNEKYRDRALYQLSGKLRIGDSITEPLRMAVFEANQTIVIEALAPSHFMLLGGDPFSEPRYIDWNFVSSSKDRLVAAREDWKAQRFGTIPGDDKEFIPLPE